MIRINEVDYDPQKMPPRTQFHVLRRLAPLLAGVGPLVLDLLDSEKDRDETMANIVGTVGPLAVALSELPDAQLDYVLDECLLRVNRLDTADQKWHPAYLSQGVGKRPLCMYKDIDAAAEMRLAAEVIKENLAGFFGQLSAGSASSLSAPKAAPEARTT